MQALPGWHAKPHEEQCGMTLLKVMICQLFWFAMLWTIGACTDADGRLFISDLIKSLLQIDPQLPRAKSSSGTRLDFTPSCKTL
eukprot:398787-Amphidinium_carterae.2